jgi:hypothetical protein
MTLVSSSSPPTTNRTPGTQCWTPPPCPRRWRTGTLSLRDPSCLTSCILGSRSATTMRLRTSSRPSPTSRLEQLPMTRSPMKQSQPSSIAPPRPDGASAAQGHVDSRDDRGHPPQCHRRNATDDLAGRIAPAGWRVRASPPRCARRWFSVVVSSGGRSTRPALMTIYRTIYRCDARGWRSAIPRTEPLRPDSFWIISGERSIVVGGVHGTARHLSSSGLTHGADPRPEGSALGC